MEGGVQRQLKQRHIAMIAIGGAIGTGLFVGSGAALSTGGPVGLWLGYCLMASMVYSMMVALGEMATLFPVTGAFTHFAARFVDPALGFTIGVNYWYSWAITLPSGWYFDNADCQPSSSRPPLSSRTGTRRPTPACTSPSAWSLSGESTFSVHGCTVNSSCECSGRA